MLVLAGQILQRGHSLVTAAKSQEERVSPTSSEVFRDAPQCLFCLFVCDSDQMLTAVALSLSCSAMFALVATCRPVSAQCSWR